MGLPEPFLMVENMMKTIFPCFMWFPQVLKHQSSTVWPTVTPIEASYSPVWHQMIALAYWSYLVNHSRGNLHWLCNVAIRGMSTTWMTGELSSLIPRLSSCMTMTKSKGGRAWYLFTHDDAAHQCHGYNELICYVTTRVCRILWQQ